MPKISTYPNATSPLPTDYLLGNFGGITKTVFLRQLDSGSIKPAFSVYVSANQSIPQASFTKINFDTIILDSNSNYSTVNKRFTPTVAGIYIFVVAIRYQSPEAGAEYVASVFKNGAEANRASQLAVSPSLVTAILTSPPIPMNGSTDYAEGFTFHGSSVAKTLNATQTWTFFGGWMIGI